MRFYLNQELLKLTEQLNAILHSWSEKWISSSIPVAVTKCEITGDLSGFAYQHGIYLTQHQDKIVHWLAGNQYQAPIELAAVFANVWEMAVSELSENINRSGYLPAERTLDDLAYVGSGAVEVSVSMGSDQLRLLLDRETVRQLLPDPETVSRKEALHGVSTLLDSTSIDVHVETSPVELTYSQITKMKVGDVLKLSHSVEKPLDIRVNRKKIAKAYLAKSNGNKALVLEG